MSGRRNVEDIILSSRNDKLLKSIRSGQSIGPRVASLSASATNLTRGSKYLLTERQEFPSISLSTLDTLVRKVTDLEDSLSILKGFSFQPNVITQRLYDLESEVRDDLIKKQAQINDLQTRLAESSDFLKVAKEQIKVLDSYKVDSSTKLESLYNNTALRDEVLSTHDKSLNALIIKLNELSSWFVRIHGSHEEIQRRLAQVDATLPRIGVLSQELQSQDRRIAVIEASLAALSKDFSYYKQEMQHALRDIHAALLSRS